MTALILLSLGLGILCGRFQLLGPLTGVLSGCSDYLLWLLLLLVGFSLGGDRAAFVRMRTMGWRILLIPAGVIAASLTAGPVCALVTGTPVKDAMIVVSGLGWSTLCGVMAAGMGSVTGVIAFLANLLRGELLSFCLVPLLARRIGYLPTLGMGGATTGDTTLPIIMRCTDRETALLAVVNGMVCSFAVPLLIRLWQL